MENSAFRVSSDEADGLQIDLVHVPAMYYALVHNAVPGVRHLRITNTSDEDITDLSVTLELEAHRGALADPWQQDIARISAGETVDWAEFAGFEPDIRELARADEAFPAAYRLRVRSATDDERRLVAPVRVLAHNEWLNSPVLYESIAAFVQPNTNSVRALLRRAGELLLETTGSGSLEGYQSGPKRVTQIAAALYEVLREQRITYVGLPASFEQTGQKVLTTAAVLAERMGNCIDLSVTYAALLEAAGLRPLIWLIEGHAFCGFFLHESRLPETVTLEPAQMINIVESDNAVAVELTAIGPGEKSAPFGEAVRAGRQHLRGQSELLGMVDVRLAHRSGIRPLPAPDGFVAETADAEQAAQPAASLDLPVELETSGAYDDDENLELRAAGDNAPERVRRWRRALLDLSLRNPLLKLPKRGKGLDLHVPAGSLPELDNLVHAGKPVHVVAQDSVGGVHELQGVRRAQDLSNEYLAEELANDRRIYGSVTSAAYTAKMRGLQRDARTMLQETGSNYLYLTLGSLVHRTPRNDEAHAPLFLIPVRIEGGVGRRPYTIVVDGDELAAPNYCLVQWLAVKHGVRIPQLQEPPTDESGIDIVAALRGIRRALVENNLEYRLDETASLRLLQFSTFQMWRDLSTHWDTFRHNDVVRHLVASSGRPMQSALLAEPHAINESDLHLPIPADGSQMRAITLAERGASFVLEGPPGTGKSQTITNLIAHAVRSGKTVLFVAEKQAALDVVKRRLAAVGLTDFCLDLHGRRQAVKSIRAQLKAALEHEPNDDAHGFAALRANYRARISGLAAYPERLHTSNAAGFSAWSAYQACIVHGDGPITSIPVDYLHGDAEWRTDAENAAIELPDAARATRLRPQHPWSLSARRDVHGIDRTELAATAQDLQEARRRFERLPQGLRDCIASLSGPTELSPALDAAELAAAGALPDRLRTVAANSPGWDDAVSAAYAAITAMQHEHRASLATFRPEFFTAADFDQFAIQADAADKGLFGKKKRRTALAEALRDRLQDGITLDRDTVLPAFRAAAAAKQAADAAHGTVAAVAGFALPATWWPTQPDAAEYLRTDYERLRVSRDLFRRNPELWEQFASLSTQLPAADLRDLVDAWSRWLRLLATTDDSFARWSGESGWLMAWLRDDPLWTSETAVGGLQPVQRWGTVLALTERLRNAGLTVFAESLLNGEHVPDDIEIVFRRSVARSALVERLAAGELEYFDAGAHERQITEYLRLGSEIRELLPDKLAAEIVTRRPRKAGRHANQAGELIRRLNSRKDRLSFREAVSEYGDVVTQLTPCFLMSPASVANFLEPGALTFDILVFDEASQIRVAQAVGAMGRARSVVVVGDSKQMPPSSIMEAAHEDTDEDPAVPEDLDSILAECVESGLPRESLTWHYRSTDESLISFSNAYYYEDKLASLPSPGSDSTTGVSLRRVDGQFDRGTRASRTNAVEASAIVAELQRLLADPRTGERSYGVVTFNIQQRDLLLNLLEESTDENIQHALAREDGEALFVKNLENVQGDERDAILFSLAFSKDPETGLLPLNFGPLSLQGGERRLNVAVTRARSQIILFSSFDPKDIDLNRTSALGTHHLRAYLEQAAKQSQESTSVTRRIDRDAHRAVEEIAGELAARGYETKTHFGLSHFTVDIAVRRPGRDRWEMAVLLDGPGWARRVTVADRDAAPHLLASEMRWAAVRRIWLPQWISDRTAVLDGLTSTVNDLTESPAELDEQRREPAPVARPPETPPADASHFETDRAPIMRSSTDSAPAVTPVHGESNAAADESDMESFVAHQAAPVGTAEQLDRLAGDREVRELVQAHLARVIAVEGPVEQDRLLRLVHRDFGMGKMSGNRRDLMARCLPRHYRRTTNGETAFIWPEHLDPATWRGFRRNPVEGGRKLEEVAQEEIANAMLYAWQAGHAHSTEQWHRATLGLLGYERLTPGVAARLHKVLTWAVTEGRLSQAAAHVDGEL